MSSDSTINEMVIPEAWDAKLVLDFLYTPAFNELSRWLEAELAALETKWRSASSPNAWRSESDRSSSRHRSS